MLSIDASSFPTVSTLVLQKPEGQAVGPLARLQLYVSLGPFRGTFETPGTFLAHSPSGGLSACMRVCLLAQLCPTLCNPVDCIAHRASLSMGFSKKEYWSGLPFPSPGDLPDPGIKPGSPALQADSLPPEPSVLLSTTAE